MLDHITLYQWFGHYIYKTWPINLIYVDMNIAYEFLFYDGFECGIAWPINNLLALPHSIHLFNIFFGKVWFFDFNLFYHIVVVNRVLIFCVMIWTNWMIIETITTIFRFNIFLCMLNNDRYLFGWFNCNMDTGYGFYTL